MKKQIQRLFKLADQPQSGINEHVESVLFDLQGLHPTDLDMDLDLDELELTVSSIGVKLNCGMFEFLQLTMDYNSMFCHYMVMMRSGEDNFLLAYIGEGYEPHPNQQVVHMLSLIEKDLQDVVVAKEAELRELWLKGMQDQKAILPITGDPEEAVEAFVKAISDGACTTFGQLHELNRKRLLS